MARRFRVLRDSDKWSYLEQWMEDCYWEALAELDYALEYDDMPKLRKLMNRNFDWEN